MNKCYLIEMYKINNYYFIFHLNILIRYLYEKFKINLLYIREYALIDIT